MHFSASGKATAIGSFPHSEAEEAFRLIMDCIPEIPVWPQLPYYAEEGMTIQYNEGMPGLASTGKKLFFDTAGPRFELELMKFYEDYLQAREMERMPLEHRFGISSPYARGFHFFLNRLSKNDSPHVALKGHITGPITLGTALTDQNGKIAYYDQRLREVVVKTLVLKARWQIHQLGTYGIPVIIFIDEPSLAAYGSSAFLGISEENVKSDLQEIIEQIHEEGALAGIHCCENTDWGMLLKTDIDILSFDAYSFFDRVILYAHNLKDFINRGRVLAWGLIPTGSSESIRKETAFSLMERWTGYVTQLIALGFERRRVIAQSLLTPSCGTGALTPALSERVMKLLKEVSEILQKEG